MGKTFWLVESRYCDGIIISRRITGSYGIEKRPDSEWVSIDETYAICRDWFDSHDAADQFIADANIERRGIECNEK
jgi:hypothetical protein